MPTPIPELYDAGLKAAEFNQRDYEGLMQYVQAWGGILDGATVATRFGFADAFAGELVMPWLWAATIYPGCFPGAGQGRGDCVSHNIKNMTLVDFCCEVASGTPDPVSGKVEIAPELNPTGVTQGVVSSEAYYWFAGNDNRKNARGDYFEDGWNTSQAIKIALSKCGTVLREPLEGTDLDFTRYDPDLAGKYADGVPDAVANTIDDHMFRTATEIHDKETTRDMIGRGYGVGADGGQSWSSTKDANGVSSRTAAGWSHAMAEVGFDDRPATIKKYGDSLVLIAQSWGTGWNKGGRDVMDSASLVPKLLKQDWIAKGIVNAETGNIMIPKGWFWSKWKDCASRRRFAVTGHIGWERRELPNLLGGFV